MSWLAVDIFGIYLFILKIFKFIFIWDLIWSLENRSRICAAVSMAGPETGFGAWDPMPTYEGPHQPSKPGSSTLRDIQMVLLLVPGMIW